MNIQPSFRYRKPGYVALSVTDLARSKHFYQDLVGLKLEQQTPEALYFRCSADHHNLVLYEAAQPGLRRIGFELESSKDWLAAQARIAQLGWPVRTVPPDELATLHVSQAFRFRLPHCGVELEYYVGMAQCASPFLPTLAKIQRLGHIVIAVKEPEKVLACLTEQLNFRVSDFFGDQVTFLRCFPNPFHHSLGVARADDNRLHHVNFMVSDVDDVGKAMNRMRKNQVEIVYGPGRHDISNSIFLYYLDPDRMTVEYSFGMEEFAELNPREPRMLPLKPEILDVWGGMPAANFAKVGAIEGERS